MNRVSPSITQSSAYDTGCRQPLQVSTYLLCPKKAFALNLQVRGRSPFGNALWESTAAACHFHSIKIKPDSTSPQSHRGGQGAAHFSNLQPFLLLPPYVSLVRLLTVVILVLQFLSLFFSQCFCPGGH